MIFVTSQHNSHLNKWGYGSKKSLHSHKSRMACWKRTQTTQNSWMENPHVNPKLAQILALSNHIVHMNYSYSGLWFFESLSRQRSDSCLIMKWISPMLHFSRNSLCVEVCPIINYQHAFPVEFQEIQLQVSPLVVKNLVNHI